jgi:hypothetical protein
LILALVLAVAIVWWPPSARPELFMRSNVTEHGTLHMREIERGNALSTLLLETDHFGWTSESIRFGHRALEELCSERGFSHFCILNMLPVRHGTEHQPGNDGKLTVAFLQEPEFDVKAKFPLLTDLRSFYPVWPPRGLAGASPSSAMVAPYVSKVFSWLHFHWKQAPEIPQPDDPVSEG